MKVKRYLALAAAVAVAFVATSAANASTTKTATVTVKWNTQAVNVVTAQSDYTVAGGVATAGVAAVTSYFQQQNGGNGTCGTPAAMTAGTVDFLNVTPDDGVANKYTDCYFKNAVNVHVYTTDSSGYGLAVAGTLPKSGAAGADVAGGPYILCMIRAGASAWANNVGAANATTSSFALANAPALDNGGTNTCAAAGTAAGTQGIVAATTAGTGGTILASQASATGTAGADFSSDMELGIPPGAASYVTVQPASVVLTFTGTFN